MRLGARVVRAERLRRAVDRWLFGPGDARRLAALRIGLASILGLRMVRGIYAGLAGQPAALYRPLSFMRLLPSMPPHPAVVILQAVGVAAAAMAVAGAWGRVSLPAAWACALVLAGMTTSVGKVVHNDVLPLIAVIPLLPAPTSDAWSVDALLRRRRARPPPAPAWSVRYGWPVRTATVAVAGAYFFIGLNKLIYSGPAWVTGDNLRFVVYAASDHQHVPNAVGLFVADRPLLAHVVAAVALLVELTFPVVLFRPALRWVYLPGVIALHAGIFVTMHLDYWPWVATVLVVFVDWPPLLDRVRASATPAYAGAGSGSARRSAPA
jgi:hypothetical protein